MDLKQKLSFETADSENIYLYSEGFFWKAYERSAIKFIQTITAYQVNPRFCEVVNMEVMSLGFPDAVLPKILENLEYEKIDEKRLVIHSVPLGDEKFMAEKSQYISKMMSELKKETARESGPVQKEPDVSPGPGTVAFIRYSWGDLDRLYDFPVVVKKSIREFAGLALLLLFFLWIVYKLRREK